MRPQPVNYSKYNWYSDTKAQNTYKNIYEEMVKKYGVPCKYLPANITESGADNIFGENRDVIFDQAIEIKLFFENYDGFSGEGDVFSQFGLTVEDELTLWADKNTIDLMDENIGEGDLIYVSMADSLFEITFVEDEEPFYLFGVQMAYKLILKKYRVSHEEEFDESGISDSDITDIINDEAGVPDSNTDFDNEASGIRDTDDDEDGSVFDDWSDF